MYLTFYGLNEKPFASTPDPRFLYFTPGHREALAHLTYAVQDNTGFLVLTGEVGTGKTSLLKALLKQLDGSAAVAFIVNSALSFDGLLEYMLEEFGIPTPGASRAQRLVALQRFLIERTGAGQNVALILDEAQHLDPDTLEQIRLLSNFETPTQKHLQILLVGQPELRAKLALPELRQLQQRITLRAVIPSLSSQEIGQYIRWRLQTAGARDLDLFTKRAIGRIAAYAGGIPRIVNMVCEHSLLIGYAHQRRRLGEHVAERAIRYLEDGAEPRKARNGVNGRRWLPRRRRARDGSGTLPRPAPTSSEMTPGRNRLLRIGIGVVSLVALVTTILLLWPHEWPGQRLFGETMGWIVKVGASRAQSVEGLVETQTKRATRLEPRVTGAALVDIDGGQPPAVLSPEAPRPAVPAAEARPAETPGPKLVSSPRTAPAPRHAPSPAPARSAVTTPAPARFEEAPSSREPARPQDADAPDPSAAIDWLLRGGRR
jgi:type II secretory pathway predicted ATPase ExeA